MTTIKAGDAEAMEAIFHEIVDKWNECGDIEIEFEPIKKKRTNKQNRAMRQGWTNIALFLNSAGWDVNETMKIKVRSVPWSSATVEAILWRPVQDAMGYEASTTKLETTDMSKIWAVISKQLAESTGVDIQDFPSMESLSESQR